MESFGMQVTLPGGYDSVKASTIQALKDQGFGILSEIDIQRALLEKVGQDVGRYEILGACNPQLAFRALTVDRNIGLLLPCNVVLREEDGGVVVSIADPEAMFAVASDEAKRDLGALPAEARARLSKALQALTPAAAEGNG